MLLYGDTEDDLAVRNDMRAVAIGQAMMDAAAGDSLVFAWLLALLNQTITDPDDREMLQLAPLKPALPKLVK